MKKIMLFASILVLSFLVACNESNDENKTGKDSNTTEREIKIEDAMGKQTIKGTPKNIVVLEWSYVEDLLALGIQPVGVADIDGYKKWVNVDKELTEGVKDVGTRQEPNLEAISRLNPDLIIATKFRHEEILDSLKGIAPVVTFAPYSKEASENQFKNMKKEFKNIAHIVDKTEDADLALTDLKEFIEEQSKRVKEAGLEGAKYIATQAYSAQNTPTIRMFTGNSMVSQIMERLSFKNAYESEELETYGYSEVTVEALQNFQDKNLQFLYIVQKDDNVFENQLKGNPVWENLSFVQNGNTHQLPGDTWTFGGILSAHVLTEQLVDSTVKE